MSGDLESGHALVAEWDPVACSEFFTRSMFFFPVLLFPMLHVRRSPFVGQNLPCDTFKR